ncbi:MAG: STAS domain-containing protein [Rhodospirillales bacterium]
MKHETREYAGCTVVALKGDIDLQTSPAAREALLAAVGGERPVLVDLSGVEYVDSSGVASLVESYQNARKAGRGFALVAVSEGAMRIFKLARLDDVFTICADLDAGAAQVKG